MILINTMKLGFLLLIELFVLVVETLEFLLGFLIGVFISLLPMLLLVLFVFFAFRAFSLGGTKMKCQVTYDEKVVNCVNWEGR
jgi:hypothetical protein